jgi:hypothetical protein
VLTKDVLPDVGDAVQWSNSRTWPIVSFRDGLRRLYDVRRSARRGLQGTPHFVAAKLSIRAFSGSGAAVA